MRTQRTIEARSRRNLRRVRRYFEVSALGVFLLCGLESSAQLRYKVSYQCNKERVEVAYCRADSDMPGFPRTHEKDNYCLVYYPDRPMRGGFTVQESELRSDIIKTLQDCGALPAP